MVYSPTTHVHDATRWFGRYLLHDPIYHLQEVVEGFVTLAGRAWRRLLREMRFAPCLSARRPR